VNKFSKKNYDLVVVGSGIIGATLVNILRLKTPDLSIALVDAASKTSISSHEFDSRVVALSKASESILRDIDVWERIVARRACPYFEMHVWDGEGTGSIHFDCADIDSDNLGHIVENSVLTSTLIENLTNSRSIEAGYGIKVEAMEAHDHRCDIALSNGQQIRTSLVVAADGAHSYLRDLAGLNVRQWQYGQSAVVATVQTEEPHQHTAWQRFGAEGPLAFLPLSLDGKEQFHCAVVWSHDSEKAERSMALDDDAFCTLLGETFEHRLGEVKGVGKRHIFPLTQRHAARYICPGLVLVGDAAHTIHPLAGQGANLGMYDVMVLAEEIARAVARGLPISDTSISKRYERRRQPHNLLAMSTMEGFKRLFGSEDLALRWLRNEGLRLADGLPWIKNTLSRIASGQINTL